MLHVPGRGPGACRVVGVERPELRLEPVDRVVAADGLHPGHVDVRLLAAVAGEEGEDGARRKRDEEARADGERRSSRAEHARLEVVPAADVVDLAAHQQAAPLAWQRVPDEPARARLKAVRVVPELEHDVGEDDGLPERAGDRSAFERRDDGSRLEQPAALDGHQTFQTVRLRKKNEPDICLMRK